MSTDLEVRHCRILIAVGEFGGVAAAARALGLAQSTISEALLSLERLLGTPVILRRPGREAALTPAAIALLPHARALIAASETALAAFAMKGAGTIRLGAVESISSFLLPGPLRAFRQLWPRVDVRIAIGLCNDLRGRVRRFELDAALTIEGADRPPPGEGERSRKLSPARLQLVVSSGNPRARETLARADLGAATFLLADPDGAFNALMRAWFGERGQSPKFESAGSIDGVKRDLRDSDAIGVLPAYATAEELTAGSLVELKLHEKLPAIALMLTAPEHAPESEPLRDLTARIAEAFDRT